MADNVKHEFAQLDEPTKVHSLLSMFKLCAYQQQLEFIEALQDLIHKDFITLLPSAITDRILAYLDVEDAVSCLSVCNSWNKVIGSSSSFWEEQARKLGLSDAFTRQKLAGTECKGLNELCRSAVNHQKYMKSIVPRSIVLAKTPAGDGYSYVYAGHGIALRYQEQNKNARVSIERLGTPPSRSSTQIASFSKASFTSRIKWASASKNYVLWKQIDGKWNGYQTNGRTLELEQWDDEPMSPGFHSITFCYKCRLLALMSEAEDDCEVWDLQVIKLMKGKSSLRKMVYPIPLEEVQNMWEKKRHFGGGKVILFPESSEVDKMGFCKSHRVLVQINSKMAVHRLEPISENEQALVVHHLLPDARLSKPITVLAPNTSDQPLSLVQFPGNRGCPSFCISVNHELIALMHECYLYVWNVLNYEEDSYVDLIDLHLPSDTKCVAVGSVYAVLASDSCGTCAVVVYRTGQVLLRGGLDGEAYNPDIHRSNRFCFYEPLEQDWLSSFKYFDFWPLAFVVDYFANKDKPGEEHEMQAIIGVHSRQQGRNKEAPVNGNETQHSTNGTGSQEFDWWKCNGIQPLTNWDGTRMC